MLIAVEKFTGFEKRGGRILKVGKWLYTMLFVLLGWVLFRSVNLENALIYLKAMVGIGAKGFADGMFIGWLVQNAVVLAVGAVLCTPLFRWLGEKTKDSALVGWLKVAGLFLLFVLSVASLVGSAYNPFIYFNF